MDSANKYIKTLEEYSDNDPLYILYDLGYSPDEIKSAIVEGLEPYFQNKKHLKDNAINLAGIWSAILFSSNNDNYFSNKISAILKIFDEAYNTDRNATMHCIRYWMPNVLQSLSRFWSQLKNQQHLKELSLEDFVEEALGSIGKCIEGLSKPYLCLTLQLNKIRSGKATIDESEKIAKLDLGSVIEELISNAKLSNILVLPLNNLKLNNWRNIAYHHNYRISNNEIIIDVKSKIKNHSFSISRNDLFEVCLRVYNVFKVFKLSFDIFIEDHISLESNWLDNKSDVLIREESRINDFRIAIASQGFKIESLDNISTDTIRMVLRDLKEDLPTKVRAIHSSQFLHGLWALSGKKMLEVEYKNKNGHPVMMSSVSGKICESIHSDEEIVKLAKHVNFNILNPELLKELDPFEKLIDKITPELANGKYYSQENVEIDVQKYIIDVSLTIFSNYLALLAEGALSENIRIEYYKDGCVIIAQIKTKNFLFRTPAPMKSKKIREILADCVNCTIENYTNLTLNSKYILQAKENNMYREKRINIKTIIDQKGE